MTSKQVRAATRRDPVLARVLEHITKGWPASVPKDLSSFFSKWPELMVESGCVLWGRRVVIPSSLRGKLLKELHKEHMGASRMKTLARDHVWWPGIDKELEALAKSCVDCAAVKQAPVSAPLHSWSWPSRPWERIHIDFAGPFMSHTYLIVVDAHSKWAEVVDMPRTTSSHTIDALRQLFATHGLPEEVVSDNGSQFTSEEFSECMKANGIRHTRSSPYHPSSNGEAERFVRTFKEAMKASVNAGMTLVHRLQNFLLTYRTTPHSSTGVPPCELLMGRHLRTKWDLLRPDIRRNVRLSQRRQQRNHDCRVPLRQFYPGQFVVAKNMGTGASWIPGVIAQQLGPLTYLVDLRDGRLWKRHVDHLKDCPGAESVPVPDSENNSSTEFDESPQTPETVENSAPETASTPGSQVSGQTAPPSSPPRRYPTRDRRPPIRY